MGLDSPAALHGGPRALLPLTARQRAGLEDLLAHTPSAKERCRAQALLWVAEGGDVEAVAESLCVSRQTVYNWMNRSRERSATDPRAGLVDAPRPGRPRTAGGAVDDLIAAVIDGDPRELGSSSTAWTAHRLGRYLHDRHAIDVCDRTAGRAIDRLHVRWKRPRHERALRPKTWRPSKGGSSAGERAGPAPCS